MEDPLPPGGERGGGITAVNPPARCLGANELNFLILNEMVERASRIRSTAHAGDDHIRKAVFGGQHLLFDFLRDHGLEIAHNRGERMRTHNRANAVVGIIPAARPLPECLRGGVLERASAGRNRHYLRSQKPHSVDIERLPAGIFLSHIDHAVHTKKGRRRRRRHPVLARAGLRNQTGLPHFLR